MPGVSHTQPQSGSGSRTNRRTAASTAASLPDRVGRLKNSILAHAILFVSHYLSCFGVREAVFHRVNFLRFFVLGIKGVHFLEKYNLQTF